MHFKTLLLVAVLACLLINILEGKPLGKHKKHVNKKFHVKHEKKQDTPQADDAAAGGNPDEPAPADDAAATEPAADDDDAGTAPAPAPNKQSAAVNDVNGNGIDDSLEQQQQNDMNSDGIDDRLQQGPQPPGPEEEEGSTSELVMTPQAKPPVLYGGHMRPGPTPEPLAPVEARYCEAPCDASCAPACYDWCCFPSIQVPPAPVQIMMVPAINPPPPPPPTPGPLQYPMNYLTVNQLCSPQPCSVKKHRVDSLKEGHTLRNSAPILSVFTGSKKHKINKKKESEKTVKLH